MLEGCKVVARSCHSLVDCSPLAARTRQAGCSLVVSTGAGCVEVASKSRTKADCTMAAGCMTGAGSIPGKAVGNMLVDCTCHPSSPSQYHH
jgi:hypothetical protein